MGNYHIDQQKFDTNILRGNIYFYTNKLFCICVKFNLTLKLNFPTESPVFENEGVTAGPTVVEGLDKLFDGVAR